MKTFTVQNAANFCNISNDKVLEICKILNFNKVFLYNAKKIEYCLYNEDLYSIIMFHQQDKKNYITYPSKMNNETDTNTIAENT